MRNKFLLLIAPLILAAGAIGGLITASTVDAQYVESNLVADSVFLDAASMSKDQIQGFLSQKNSYLASYSSYSDRDGGNVSASQIIYEAAQDYGVSPKVILATLQKEQSLVTDPDPQPSQINFAMGYGCPDSGSCSYPGFFRQVDNGTWQLRLSMERARGNNSWWNPNIGYACNGATRYYNTALKSGNTVTFYDDYGTAYKTFTLANGSTASLYCYTPHAYPGSSQQYYSGSYNFVVSFEAWFGTTQPDVAVTSPLRVESLTRGGYFTGNGVKVSFDMTNYQPYPIDVGGMAVMVRDSQQRNFDYTLKPFTVPAYSTITYSDVQNFNAEGIYTFSITNLRNGAWSNSYPTTSIDTNPRTQVAFIQAAPVFTQAPNLNPQATRTGKNTIASFTISNPSSQSVNLGSLALAVRGPNGINADYPLESFTIAANSAKVYSFTRQFTTVGRYSYFLTNLANNNWYTSAFPITGASGGVNGQFDVLPSPTLLQGPQLDTASPRVGQQATLSFKVKNYGDSSVSAGNIGIAIRDPQGRNLDFPAGAVSINANNEYTFSGQKTFSVPGQYTAFITSTRNGGVTWDDMYPVSDNSGVVRRINFTIQPSPTVTVQPTITTTDIRSNAMTQATFTLHNYGDSSVNVGALALAVRGPGGVNADFPLQNVTIAAGQDYVYTAQTTLPVSGAYTAWITSTRDGGTTWNDTSYPIMESANLQRKIQFTAKPNPTLTQGPLVSPASPRVNQAATMTFKVRNFGTLQQNVGGIGLAVRDPQGRNVDAGLVQLMLDPLQEYTFQATPTFTTPGVYTAWVTVTRNGGITWDDISFPANENQSVVRKIQFTVQP